MAKLLMQNGTQITNINEILNELACLNVVLSQWPIKDREVKNLLLKEQLSNQEKELVLSGLDHYFQALQKELGYQSRDLIVLHEELEGLSALMSKFDRCHTHDDDEVRYIVDGEGVFGFVKPDGSQIELLLEAGEYINVPKDTQHWFYLTNLKRIKAVRYFTSMEGWSPVYTDTDMQVERVW